MAHYTVSIHKLCVHQLLRTLPHTSAAHTAAHISRAHYCRALPHTAALTDSRTLPRALPDSRTLPHALQQTAARTATHCCVHCRIQPRALMRRTLPHYTAALTDSRTTLPRALPYSQTA
jgi:hypothetical protein